MHSFDPEIQMDYIAWGLSMQSNGYNPWLYLDAERENIMNPDVVPDFCITDFIVHAFATFFADFKEAMKRGYDSAIAFLRDIEHDGMIFHAAKQLIKENWS